MKHLVIVESPNKIKSIEKYLGKNYQVLASKGHIVYLPSTGEERFGIDLATWTPKYKIDPDKNTIVTALKKVAKKADLVYVATDPDREGEAIADNLVTFLQIGDKYKRIRFNEITESAVNAALASPTTIDELLVKSQVARRILDRIIGFKLSNLMRTKIASAPSAPSAGRVQSIALKIIIARENEIEAFVPVTYYKLTGELADYENVVMNYYNATNELNKEWLMPENLDSVQKALTKTLVVKNVDVSQRNDTKYTPLKQAALYRRADSMFSLSASSVQRAAQNLYEGYGDGGLISYPRTDSTRLSNTFVTAAQAYITSTFGAEYVAKEIKGTAGAQDAHEAIRPTDLELTPEMAATRFKLPSAEVKIYQLIWTHTIQALMNPARREYTRYEMEDNGVTFRATSTQVLFDGYLKVTGFEAKKPLPPFKVGAKVSVKEYQFEKHETQPPARYNDGALIEKLDEIGVGRPSTFASTVNILSDRNYATYEGRTLKPTEFGKIVMRKLQESFPEIMDEKYTANLEKELDEIAEGKFQYEQILSDFWSTFQKDLQTATQELEITKIMPTLANKKCPVCGSELYVRRNKSTKIRFFGCSNYPVCTYSEPDPTEKRRPFKFNKAKVVKPKPEELETPLEPTEQSA